MSTKRNYYDILEISPSASSFEIEQAYQKLASFWHPDRHRENRKGAQEKFHDINEAYEHLSNRNSRQHYDNLLSQKFSIEDANHTFEKFFDEHGPESEDEKAFLESNYPKKARTYYDVLEINRNATQD